MNKDSRTSNFSLVPFTIALAAMLLGLGALIARTWTQPHRRDSGATANGQIGKTAAQSAFEKTRLNFAEKYGKLPLRFEANEGQTGNAVKFLSRGKGYSLFLSATESVMSLNRLAAKTGDAVLRMRLLHANENAPAKGLEELSGKSNYFIGNDTKQWRMNVPNYGKVKFAGVYPGVDLVYYGNQRQLEYDFMVAPGADPSLIQLGFAGAQHLKITPEGELRLTAKGAEVRWQKPYVYQEVDGARHEVEGRYLLTGKNAVGFEVGPYDASKALIIDPQLVYSTYLGGSSSDSGFGIAADSSGNAYVVGATGSTDFPTANPLQAGLASSGSTNAFVAKLNAAGDGLVYSTYLGGSGGGALFEGDQGSSIAVDSTGNAYITGFTFSSDFPTTPGAFQTTAPGTGVQFVAKLNPAGNALVYSTYLGGSNLGAFLSLPVIAIDSSGNAYVAGGTFSPDFPTVNAAQSAYGGGGDCFVSKLNPGGTGLIYSTYLGGNNQDQCSSIAVNSSGEAYVTGVAQSMNFQYTTSVGKGTGFVVKLNNSGTGIAFSTQLGGISGSHGDVGGGAVALDASGNVYLAGTTTATDFPATLNAFQTTMGGGNTDGYVMKLDSAGANIQFATYLGGNAGDGCSGIALDASGKIFVTGVTNSTDFPTSGGGTQLFFGGGNSDAFMAEIDPSSVGSGTFVFGTYLGGSGADHAFNMSADSAGNVYIVGNSGSSDFPTTTHSFQPGSGGGTNDSWVAKFATGGGGPAANIQATSGATQSVAISAAFGPMTVSVTDAGGNGVSGANVTFSAPTSGASGSFSGGATSASVATNSSGAAAAPAFTANAIAGSYSVTASVAGVTTTASFSLTNTPGPAATIAATAGTPQGALINSSFATTFKATVQDSAGNGISGATVTFTAPASGASGTFAGSLTTASATTDSSGVATSPTFTAGGAGGSYSINATVAGVGTAANFTLTNVDYTLQPANAGTVQITAGTPSSVTLNLTTTPAATALPADVQYSCSAPSSLTGATCSLSPAKTSVGNTSGSTTLTISTTANMLPFPRRTNPWGPQLIWLFSAVILWLLVILLAGRPKTVLFPSRPVLAPVLVVLIIGVGVAGCSSSPKSMSTPKGASTITVMATSGVVSKTTTININVK